MHFIIILIISISLLGCGNKDPYANLDKEDREIMYQKEVEKKVGTLICNQFITETYDYEVAKKKKEFVRFHVYFTDYSKLFERLKSAIFYELYQQMIRNILKAEGIPINNVEFKDMPLPEINTLGCDDAIQKWINLRDEWTLLERTLPDEFFSK
jgi:hypothetical protein